MKHLNEKQQAEQIQTQNINQNLQISNSSPTENQNEYTQPENEEFPENMN